MLARKNSLHHPGQGAGHSESHSAALSLESLGSGETDEETANYRISEG